MSETRGIDRTRGWWRAQPGWKQAVYLLVAWAALGLYLVGPDQVAIVRVFGRAAEPVTAGIWWRPPWPLSRVNRVRLSQPRQVDIVGVTGLGLIGQETPSAEHLTGDQNLVRVRAVAQYTINDPHLYLFGAERIDQVVSSVVAAHLTSSVAATGVDPLMTTGQTALNRTVLDGAQETLDRYGLGITIASAAGGPNLLQEVRPPAEAQQAFDDVSSAKQDYERKINEAHGYANEVVPRAKGEAAELLNAAEGYRVRTVNEATGRAARFRDLAAEYRRAPQVTRTRLQLEAVDRVAPRLKTTVVDSDGGRRPIDLGIIGLPDPPASTP